MQERRGERLTQRGTTILQPIAPSVKQLSRRVNGQREGIVVAAHKDMQQRGRLVGGNGHTSIAKSQADPLADGAGVDQSAVMRRRRDPQPHRRASELGKGQGGGFASQLLEMKGVYRSDAQEHSGR